MSKEISFEDSKRLKLGHKETPEAPAASEAGDMVGDLCTQVRQLMNEVRECDRKRDEILNQIETLMTEIRNEAAAAELQAAVEPAIDFMGSVKQLRLPCCSARVLESLDIDTIAEAVAFFGNFQNFVDADNRITLLEWSVMRHVLHDHNLITLHEQVPLTLSMEEMDLGVRAYNCLRRGDIRSMYDLVLTFANGAGDGWRIISRFRNLGASGVKEIVDKLSGFDLSLDETFCYPTLTSPVAALDFDPIALKRLDCYRLNMVGKLLAKCHDDSDAGLRAVDYELYRVAVSKLEKYGFDAAGLEN